MPRVLNVVSFDIPFPPNYGGVIDVFYKLRWLKAEGVAIILHCFTNRRDEAPYLEELCEKVYYYRRRTGLAANFSRTPYTVLSRRSSELASNLLQNDHPILFEVLHTCDLADDPRFSSRLRIYRHSNIEHEYYRHLARSEKKLSKKLFLFVESFRLRRFERVLRHVNMVLAVNQKDTQYFNDKYPEVKSYFLPSFHPYEEVDIRVGVGSYVLYHGNLSISENYESASWLIEHVFSHVIFRVVIAGLNPPDFLLRQVSKYKHIEVIANPTGEKMDELIAGAQVHCLHTHQATGLKLKLLHVLFRGRHVVANNEMLAGTGLRTDNTLTVAGSANEYVSEINRLFTAPFIQEHVNARRNAVQPFMNQVNARKLIGLVFSG